MIRFVVRPYRGLPGEMVEVWDGDDLLGGIYPGNGETREARALRVISRHISALQAPRAFVGLSDAVTVHLARRPAEPHG